MFCLTLCVFVVLISVICLAVALRFTAVTCHCWPTDTNAFPHSSVIVLWHSILEMRPLEDPLSVHWMGE